MGEIIAMCVTIFEGMSAVLSLAMYSACVCVCMCVRVCVCACVCVHVLTLTGPIRLVVGNRIYCPVFVAP